MGLDKKFLLKGLLQYNYFPLQKKDKEELPPILNSECLTPEISEKLKKLPSRKGGYDQVGYKVTRYNNVPRSLSIPHPIAYAKLCHSLYDNWEELESKFSNKDFIAFKQLKYPSIGVSEILRYFFPTRAFSIELFIKNNYFSFFNLSICHLFI